MEHTMSTDTQTPLTDAALFNHSEKTRIASLEVVAAVAEVSRRLERDRAELIAALAKCVTDNPGSACFNTGRKTRRLEAINETVSAALARVQS
jgi:hypothetical protein